MSTALQPRNVVSLFNYYPRPIEEGPPKPIAVHLATKLDDSLSKIAEVHDIRGTELEYSLETSGFQIINHISTEKSFLDDEQIKLVYYPEMEVLFKEITGASKVVIFDHTIRRQPFDYLNKNSTAKRDMAGLPVAANPKAIPKSLRGPLHNVHIDQSYAGAAMLARDRLGIDEANKLLSGRYQIINAWRPIKTILRDPFAVCDARSILDEELVPIKLIYTQRESETFSVRPPLGSRTDGGHKWCYLHKQTPTEVLMFKIFDSRMDVARRVAHSAFSDKEYECEEARQSIELRALLFYEETLSAV